MPSNKQLSYLKDLLEKTPFQSEQAAIREAIADGAMEMPLDGIEVSNFEDLWNDAVSEMIEYLKEMGK